MLEVPDGSGARPWADISNKEKLEARLVRYGEKEIGAERGRAPRVVVKGNITLTTSPQESRHFGAILHKDQEVEA